MIPMKLTDMLRLYLVAFFFFFQYGPQDIRPVHNDILIAKLRPGQVLYVGMAIITGVFFLFFFFFFGGGGGRYSGISVTAQCNEAKFFKP